MRLNTGIELDSIPTSRRVLAKIMTSGCDVTLTIYCEPVYNLLSLMYWLEIQDILFLIKCI